MANYVANCSIELKNCHSRPDASGWEWQ